MTRLSLKLTRQRHVVDGRPVDRETEASLKADPRPGARAILLAIERRRLGNRAEGQRLRKLLRYETVLWEAGISHVAGVDEAGMSPLAGPVAAAAVVFARDGERLAGIDDSKKLDARAREAFATEIKKTAVCWSVGFASVEEIDDINIYWAGLLAMTRAIEGLATSPGHVLIDGRQIKSLKIPQQKIIGGDGKSVTIAAASILAKTARDVLMCKFDTEYPGYGFAQHKGYPVHEHRRALQKLGACPLHRRSFAPVRDALGLPPLPPWPKPQD